VTENAPIRFRDGRLYISREAYDTYFDGGGAVALLRNGSDLLVLPVRHAAAGGYILKIRNSAGDRVVTAPDFFQAGGITETGSWDGTMAWSKERAAVALYGFFRR
jgi:hypothetical protein